MNERVKTLITEIAKERCKEDMLPVYLERLANIEPKNRSDFMDVPFCDLTGDIDEIIKNLQNLKDWGYSEMNWYYDGDDIQFQAAKDVSETDTQLSIRLFGLMREIDEELSDVKEKELIKRQISALQQRLTELNNK
jgi:hypothetical protein